MNSPVFVLCLIAFIAASNVVNAHLRSHRLSRVLETGTFDRKLSGVIQQDLDKALMDELQTRGPLASYTRFFSFWDADLMRKYLQLELQQDDLNDDET